MLVTVRDESPSIVQKRFELLVTSRLRRKTSINRAVKVQDMTPREGGDMARVRANQEMA